MQTPHIYTVYRRNANTTQLCFIQVNCKQDTVLPYADTLETAEIIPCTAILQTAHIYAVYRHAAHTT